MAAATSSKAALQERFVGKNLHEVPTPSIVLDLAKLELNCRRMTDAAQKNGIGWRAHIKTHKTEELTRLQVGEDPNTSANIIVSTIFEAEKIAPLLQEFQSKGRKVNVLYSFPLYPSIIPRVSALTKLLGLNSISLMIDHPTQVPLLAKIGPHPPQIFLKIDVNYNRAGVLLNTPTYTALLRAALDAHTAGHCILHGLYAHAGQSYYTREDWAALAYLTTEFTILAEAARDIRAMSPIPLVLSVGATPTATALQHPDISLDSTSTPKGQVATLSTLLKQLKDEDLSLEVHAGVYPTLDLQQLATHARDRRLLTSKDIAISVVAEVASLYEGRGANGTTEALINAGSLALGREPCKEDTEGDYNGWGIVAPWGEVRLAGTDPAPEGGFPAKHGGWQVGRISQEHGVLVWKGPKEGQVGLSFGQRVRVWPNHACIAGAGFGYYLIVDSRREGKEDEVLDVWERWNGW